MAYIRYPGFIATSLSPSAYPLLAPDGTAAAPSFSFLSDPDCGMYLSAANTLAFSTSGVNRITVGSTGAVTLKASTTTLQIKASDDVVVASFNNGDAYTITLGRSGATESITANGGLGVVRNVSAGTATPSTLAMNYVGGNTLSATNQIAYYGLFTSNSSATSSTRGVNISLATAATSYTTVFASAFFGEITAGAGSTITRAIIFDSSNGFTANGTITSKAYFADNQAFTGSYMFHIASTLPSNIGGPLVVGSSNGFTGTNYLLRATTSGTVSLTGVSQYGVHVDPTFTNASTTEAHCFLGQLSTTNSSYTTTLASTFYAKVGTKGAAMTITRLAAFLGDVPSTGTNNAFIADNTAYTGSYFLNSTSTNASLFSGIVNLSAGLRNKVSTANISTPPTAAELTSAFGSPATVGAGFQALVNDNAGGAVEYFVWTDGTSWFYVLGTIAV